MSNCGNSSNLSLFFGCLTAAAGDLDAVLWCSTTKPFPVDCDLIVCDIIDIYVISVDCLEDTLDLRLDIYEIRRAIIGQ